MEIVEQLPVTKGLVTWWCDPRDSQSLSDILRILANLSYVDRTSFILVKDECTNSGYFLKANMRR